MATDKKYSISIGNLKETISDVQSLGEALEKSGESMSEYEKLEQKLVDYDKEYQKSLQVVKSELADKNKAVKEEVELEKANLTVQENIRNSYNDKQKVMSALGKQIKSMNTDTAEQKKKQQELIQEYNVLNEELKAVDQQMGNNQRNVGNYSAALKDAKQQLKELKGEMMGLDQHSEAFQKLAAEAGATTDKINDINAAIKRNASDTKYIDSVIDVAKSATAAFGLWKGAMSAFGMETEAAEEAIQKLAGAMSIIQSLQTLSDTLQSTSATAQLLQKALKLTGAELIVNQVNAIKAATAEQGLTAAQKAGTIASKAFGLALKSIPFMLVISAIATLITHWQDIVAWINKTFPAIQKCGGVMNWLKSVAMGLGKAIVNYITNPFKTLVKVITKVFKGDFKGALQEVKNGITNQFKGTADAFKKGYQEQVKRGLEETTKATITETNKQTKYELDMLKARLGNEAKYSKAGIDLQKKDFEERRKLAKGNKDELNKINIEEANFFRECQEHKTAAAKKSAAARQQAEKAAAAEAKRIAEEAEKKRKEEEKAAEEQRKKEEEAAKALASAKSKGIALEIDYTKTLLDEKKRVLELDLKDNETQIKASQDRIKKLQAIVNNERLTKKTRAEAAELLEKEEKKLNKIDAQRISDLKQIADLEIEIVNLNRQKSENAVLDELKDQLGDLTLTKNELWNIINGTSDKVTGFTELQLQYVKNAAMQMKTIVQEAQSSINTITNRTAEKSRPTPQPSNDNGGGKKKKLAPDDGKDYWEALYSEIKDTIVPMMYDSITMFMDFALEETQRALEEVENMHDKALDKVNESADKIKELNDKLKDSSETNKDAIKAQLADEQLLYAQRLEEEQKLQEEETALKNKAAQQEAQARKVELGYQMVMGVANTAQGITKALATFAPPMSIVMASAIGALGAVQTALIAAQISKIKPVKYAEGGTINSGIVQGKPHSQGGARIEGTNIEVEGGEMVVNKKSTIRYRDVLYKINNNDPSVRYLQGNTKKEFADTKIRKYANGGTLNFQAADDSLKAQQNTNRLIGAINDLDMNPIVSVVDIAKVQSRLVKVRGLAGR